MINMHNVFWPWWNWGLQSNIEPLYMHKGRGFSKLLNYLLSTGCHLGICREYIYDKRIFRRSKDLRVCFYDVSLHGLSWSTPLFYQFYNIFVLEVSLHVITALKQLLLWCLIVLFFLCVGQKYERLSMSQRIWEGSRGN